ncbi:MAG: hypothetical protein ACOZBW_14195, partial [Thermodesulfobacteriota bacterium]
MILKNVPFQQKFEILSTISPNDASQYGQKAVLYTLFIFLFFLAPLHSIEIGIGIAIGIGIENRPTGGSR